jgi:hypothetical protein
VAYLFLPLLGGALLVALATRFRWLPALAGPIDRGATLRGRRLFGDNKTVRGLLAGAVGTALAMVLQARVLHALPVARALEYRDYAGLAVWRVGLGLGLARMLSELPNSFLKRQLDVPPGQSGRGGWAPVLHALDHLDYLPGSWLVLAGIAPVTATRLLLSVLLVLAGHRLAILAGYGLRIRRSLH